MGVAYKKSRLCNWIWCLITAAVIAGAIVIAVVIIKNKKSSSSGGQSPGSSFSGNYTESMRLALTFLDVQKCKHSLLPFLYILEFSFTKMSVCCDGNGCGVLKRALLSVFRD